MSRSERLLDLIQTLRGRRTAVTGRDLAQELGVSLRTLYRDIATLQGQGAPIEGEAGLGYVLRPGFTLPPLMFSVDAIEALVLGSRWVAVRVDDRLGAAARSAMAKIAAVVPAPLADDIDASTLLVAPGPSATTDAIDLGLVRRAIRSEHRLCITYRDGKGEPSERAIWPFALGFFDSVRIIIAWCELREDFRHFRTDRILALATPGTRFPGRRHALMKEWRKTQNIPLPG